jgi:MFS family permease
MPESPVEVLALFTGAMLGASLCIMATGALMPFFRNSLHLDQSQLGWILSVQFVGSVAMTSVAGLLTDRFGDKAVVLWSAMLMGIALIVAGLHENYWWLLGFLLLYSVGYAAVTPAGSHAIIFFFSRERRGFAMGVRQCGVPAAGVVGSLLLPFIAQHYGYQGALIAAGILTLVAGTIASRFYREPVELHGERVSLQTMLAGMLTIARESRLILMTLTSMVLITGQLALMGFWTLTLVHRAGYSLGVALALFTVSQVAAIAGRLSWGWLSDHVFKGSRALPLATVCVLVAVIAAGIAAIGLGTPVWIATLLSIALGFTAEGWLGVSVISFAEIGGEQHSGSALGVGLTWTLVAGFATPAVFGALIQVYGFDVAWRLLAALQICGVVPALLASRKIAPRVTSS